MDYIKTISKEIVYLSYINLWSRRTLLIGSLCICCYCLISLAPCNTMYFLLVCGPYNYITCHVEWENCVGLAYVETLAIYIYNLLFVYYFVFVRWAQCYVFTWCVLLFIPFFWVCCFFTCTSTITYSLLVFHLFSLLLFNRWSYILSLCLTQTLMCFICI